MKNIFRISGVIILIQLILLIHSCKKDSPPALPPALPIVTTTSVSEISYNTATSGGDVTSEGGAPIVSRGVCWNTSMSPTIANSKTIESGGLGSFKSTITGLAEGIRYNLRAYATNKGGTSYGDEWAFTTQNRIKFNPNLSYGTVTDIDGNIYKTITIGNQVWMAENLKTTKYNNGDLIGTTIPATLNISSESAPKYQWSFKGDESNVATYGRLYTWYAITDSRNVCPTGWHVSTDAEWITLTTYLGGVSIAGSKLKEAGAAHWQSIGPTNESGFTALPGACRQELDNSGYFEYINYYGYWWCSTEFNSWFAYTWRMFYSGDNVDSDIFYLKRYGFSVRCVKD